MTKKRSLLVLFAALVLFLCSGCQTERRQEETTEPSTASAETVSAEETAPSVPETAVTAPVETAATQPTAPPVTAPSEAAPTEAVPDISIPLPGEQNDYERMRQGTFYYSALVSTSDMESEMRIGVSSGTTAVVTQYQGIELGFMLTQESNYLLYPPKNLYIELSPAVLKILKLDLSDLLDQSQFDTVSMLPLSQATEVYAGKSDATDCLVYDFRSADGSSGTRIYMNGDRMLCMETLSNGEVTSTSKIRSFSAEVPQELKSISSYQKVNPINFLSLLKDIADSAG